MLSIIFSLLQLSCLVMCLGSVHHSVHVHLIRMDETPQTSLSSVQIPTPKGRALPSGYVKHPEIGSAYKIVTHLAKWSHARKACGKGGGRLAVIDTPQKIEYLRSQRAGIGHIWVGIFRENFNTKWLSVDNSKIAEFLPWGHIYRGASRNCLTMSGKFPGLSNWPCIQRLKYACEVRIDQQKM